MPWPGGEDVHVHCGGELNVPQMTSRMRVVLRRPGPLALRAPGCRRTPCDDGAASGFAIRAERLLDDVGEATFFVAGRGVGAAVDAAAAEVFVVPAHLADESRATRGFAARGG